MQGELVSYAIIEKAFTNYQSGVDVPYTLSIDFKSNIGYFPKASSALAQAITDAAMVTLTQSDGTKVSMAMHPNVRVTNSAVHPLVQAPSWMYKSLPSIAKAWDWLENAYGQAKPYIGTAMKIG